MNSGTLNFVWPWLAAVLSGVLLTLCYAPFDQSWLCWIALVPLICAVWFPPPARRPWLQRALTGYVAGVVFFTGVFAWLGTLGTLFQNPWLHALPLLLSFYMALFTAFWAWAIGSLARSHGSLGNLRVAFLGAAAWVAQEWVRGWLFSGFGWNGLGIALHANLPMIQIAEYTGVAGVSFLIAFCNLILVLVVKRIHAELGPVFLKKIRWEFSGTMAVVALAFAFGMRTLLEKPAGATETLRVAAVQANIAQADKFNPESEEKIFRQFDKLTSFAAAGQPQLILWSESATPRGMFEDKTNYDHVVAQARRGDYALLIGTLDFDVDRHEDYNVAALLTGRGQHVETHRKMHLVPFGEFLPFRKSIPLMTAIAGELVPGDFTPGRDFSLLHLPAPELELGALICFEDTLGDLTRHFVKNGADVLVNVTNDGWFLRSAAAEQHLANAVFRAVENRRPLIRCANTGVTCSIDPTGRVDRWLPPFGEGFAQREIRVPMDGATTFYTRHGEVFAIGCAVVTLLVIVNAVKDLHPFAFFKRRRAAGRANSQ